MLTKFRRVILNAGSAIIGKVKLVDKDGTDITEEGNIKVKVSSGSINLLDQNGIDLTNEDSEAIKVGVTRPLPTGTNRIGTVSGVLKTITTQKILVGGACVAGDILSENITVATPWIFPAMARVNGGSGYIVGATALLQTTALTPRLTLFLFRSTPTSSLLDNVANTAPILADRSFWVGQIDFPAMEDLGTGTSVAVATSSTGSKLPLPFVCDGNTTDLKGIVVTRDAVTPTALDILQISLTVEQY